MREAHRAKVPYIVAPQGSLEGWALGRSRYPKALYATFVEKPYFDRAASMQALTEAEAEQCRQFGIRAPVDILPNGVDLSAVDRASKRADLRSELSLPRESVLWLFLGRLFPKKGLDLLIPAFRDLVGTHPDAFLLIAGDDGGSGYRAIVEDLIQKSGIGGRVRMLGEVRGTRKFEVMGGADVFVLPSYSEGLPVAVLEAMACSCPVVVTQHCNLPEVETRNAGWVVDATVESVVEGLRAATNSADERRRRGTNARALIAERYTWDRIASDSVSLYGTFPVH
jgi:glycosyltransferase involved in cell wall biosynthesis